MRIRLSPFLQLAIALAMSTAVHGQGRPGLPVGIPAGIPMGVPVGVPGSLPHAMPPGVAVGPPSTVPGSPDVSMHGAVGAAGEAANHALHGLEVAQAALTERLSKPEVVRAREMVKAAPQDYELDRRGALVIRGEVMISGLNASQLAHIERAGFPVLRKDEVPGLGMTLAVVATDGLSATRALRKLKRLEPDGDYALNHVLFESGRRIAERPAAPIETGSASSGMTVVGLIDTGVAPEVESAPRIHLVRRNFAPSESRPELHGTAVATLLAREPGRVTVYAADIFGSGQRGGTSELLIRALGWMVGERVPVINVSMVGPSNGLVSTVIAKMIQMGFTIVAPVGNDGPAARPMFPASYPGVIAVSGAETSGALLPEASRVTRVDFVAPGIATVPDPSGGEAVVRGTSFAAPIVSRCIADLVRAPVPAASREAIARLAKSALRSKTDGKWFGYGLIGIGVAVSTND